MRAVAGVAVLIAGLPGCALVGGDRVDRLVDPDGDGWPADVDCDNRDPSRGAAELTDDGVDDDCDGVAVFDLRSWPLPDGCWARGEGSGTLLVADGAVLDGSGERPADHAVLTEDLDGDGVGETLRAVGSTILLEPSGGGQGHQVELEGPPGAIGWGSVVSGCPTAVVVDLDPAQSAWQRVRRVDLCTGTPLGTWTHGATDRSFADARVLALDPDRWPDLLVSRPDRPTPDVAVRLLLPSAVDTDHEGFNLRIVGPGPPFGRHVALGDLDGDGARDLAVSGGDGVWIVEDIHLDIGPTSDVVLDVEQVGTFVPTASPRGVTFQDLDGDGRDAVLVAVDGEGGPRLHGYDASGAAVAFGAAPDGPCGAGLALGSGVLASGGAAWALPGAPP